MTTAKLSGPAPKLKNLANGQIAEMITANLILGRTNNFLGITNDKKISRKHCEILLQNNRLYIRDLNSTNKTFVNGRAIPPQEMIQLQKQDKIQIGNQQLEVVQLENSVSTATGPSEIKYDLNQVNQDFIITDPFSPEKINRLKIKFEEEIRPTLKDLEKHRLTIRIFQIFAFSPLIVFFILPKYTIELLFFAFILLLSSSQIARPYRKRFKEEVTTKILRLIGPSWEYRFNLCISAEDFNASRLFKTPAKIFDGDDYIKGKIGKIPFEFSEIINKEKRYTFIYPFEFKLFHGIFMHLEFNKHIKGSTIVLPEKRFPFLNNYVPKNTELVKLENSEFEKKYRVYSSDQVEARYILTPKLMENILYFQNKIPGELSLSFIDNHLYLAIKIGREILEPRIYEHGVDFNDMMEIYNIFGLASIVINEFELSKRIWTKK